MKSLSHGSPCDITEQSPFNSVSCRKAVTSADAGIMTNKSSKKVQHHSIWQPFKRIPPPITEMTLRVETQRVWTQVIAFLHGLAHCDSVIVMCSAIYARISGWWACLAHHCVYTTKCSGGKLSIFCNMFLGWSRVGWPATHEQCSKDDAGWDAGCNVTQLIGGDKLY